MPARPPDPPPPRKPSSWEAFASSRFWAVLILIDLLFFAWSKARSGVLPEMLWACNAASVLLVPALWFRWTPLVGAAFLVRLAVGEAGHLYSLFTTGQVIWLSASVHVLPTLGAFFYLKRAGLPRSSPYLGAALICACVSLSRLTPPALNVNLVYQRHDFLARLFPGLWTYRLGTAGLVLALLFLGDLLLGWWLKRPGHGGRSAWIG